jgi:2-hydroxychromene-2-carboxylate isomerase
VSSPVGDNPVAAAFYFDLASPLAYLLAERVLHELPVAAQWQPVLARELGPARPAPPRDQIERRARELGLQPLRWPDPFPFDSALAMRVATYATSIGRTVPFAQAAFRQAFAGGRSLAEPDNVLIAAAACEMHPAAVMAAECRPGVAAELAAATAAAAAAGVREVPAVRIGARVFAGERALAQALEELGARR